MKEKSKKTQIWIKLDSIKDLNRVIERWIKKYGKDITLKELIEKEYGGKDIVIC